MKGRESQKSAGPKKEDFEEEVQEPQKEAQSSEVPEGKGQPLCGDNRKSEQFEGLADQPGFSCCLKCNNRELVRAVKSQNLKLLKNILENRKV